jgi:hypothetical protein
MPEYILDTNAYALLFQAPRSPAGEALEMKICSANAMSFLLPEIVSMEIHSVIGKYRRGGTKGGHEPCNRQIFHEAMVIRCSNNCVTNARKRLTQGEFKGLQKMLADIEHGHGTIKAELLPLGAAEITYGKLFLSRHADSLAFGSHDSLVAATAFVARKAGRDVTLVTSDKSLKAVCKLVGVPVFDPGTAPSAATSVHSPVPASTA